MSVQRSEARLRCPSLPSTLFGTAFLSVYLLVLSLLHAPGWLVCLLPRILFVSPRLVAGTIGLWTHATVTYVNSRDLNSGLTLALQAFSLPSATLTLRR